MGGSASVPNTFATQSGNVPASQLDANWTALVNYINNREITLGGLAARPAASISGRLYFATDVNGGTLYEDNGSVWTTLTAGINPVFPTVAAHSVVISEWSGSAAVGLLLTKGQLLVGQTGADPQALPISADSFVLTLDSTQALGVKWAPSGGVSAAGFALGLYVGLQTGGMPVM